MMHDDRLQNYYVVAFAIHLFFIVTLKISASLQDISSIGETGMNIQMIVIEKSDAEYKSKSLSENTQETTDKSEKDQEVILDNRKTGDISNRTYDTYFAKIRRIIDSNKRYPIIARQRQQEGSPKVTFTILRSGDIKDLMVRSSGHRLLDREARRMILTSAPFPKIPDSFKKTSIKLTIPINFSLDRKLPTR
tara:strand:- start:2615 stop:3190 length:576 start_codon:yes stop_codon:yes gene_type:complete